VKLRQDLARDRHGGLILAHPIIVAAGGGGFGSELLESVGELTPGAVVTSTVTRTPRRGAPAPRMVPSSHGILHALGSPNPGLDAVLRRHAARWGAAAVPVIVSLPADDAEDIAALARTLEMQPEVAGIELDLGAADNSRGGTPTGLDVEASEIATVAARAATDLPLVVRLSSVAPDIRVVARAVAAAGADAVSVSGSVRGLELERGRVGSALGSPYGWLSGPVAKPVGLRLVHEVAQAVRIPVLGAGGVHTLDDVLDYLSAGASAVGLATAALADPALPGRLGRELAAWGDEHGVGDVRELIGRALPRRTGRGSRRRR
jgi:dihydroorotate dehydrogenase (NAD+) catalytic subunit